MSLDDDLARWEAGYLSREELIASYASNERNLAEPLERNLDKNLERNLEKNLERNLDKNLVPDVVPELALVKMLELHEQLVDIGSEPVPYHESDWEQLRDSLPDRLPTRRVFGTGRLARPFIAASMVVGLTAGAAAASPTVREQMISIWHGIEHNIGLVDDPSQVEHRSPITVSPHAPGTNPLEVRPERPVPATQAGAPATLAITPATAATTRATAATTRATVEATPAKAPATPTARPVAATPAAPATPTARGM